MNDSNDSLSQKFSPAWLERMQSIIPKDQWNRFLEACIEPLPKTIRTKKVFKNKGSWNLSPVAEIPEAHFLHSDITLGKTIPHYIGEAYSATLSSLLAVHILDPQPDEKILDMCAAPGSKTTFISDRMNNTGTLIANEMKPNRSHILKQNINRMGCWNTLTTQKDARDLPDFFHEEFDRILLDAPCSSEGYGRKDAKFYTHTWKEKNIEYTAQLQKQLITAAFEMLQIGGEMLYSTCTAAPEENEMVVQHLLDTYSEAELIPIDLGAIPHTDGISTFREQKICSDKVAQSVKRLYPHLQSGEWNSEFFFLAKIKKTELTRRSFHEPDIPSSPYEKLKKNKTAEILTILRKRYGIEREHFKGTALLEKNNIIYLSTPDLSWFLKRIKAQHVGIPLFNRETGILTDFAIHFGSFATHNVLELTEEQKEKFLYGYDLLLPDFDFEHGQEIIVRFEGTALGYGKFVQGKLKNKLDRWRVWR